MNELLERIKMALGAMAAGGPRNLTAYLSKPGPDFTDASAEELRLMVDRILSSDPNDPAQLQFSDQIRAWDNSKDGPWIGDTLRNTGERRRLVYRLLKIDQNLQDRINSLLPFFPLDEPLIIAQDHQDWYKPSLGVRDYYWRTYYKYLKERVGWPEISLLSLDNSTRSIVECIADPESKRAYSSRGLVMGYVQSGKTANFAGVVARAADAGYRLIIVLAGTWNILRNQTQRRFDKQLLGKELLHNDETYQNHRPDDWDEFLEHGFYPPDRGKYYWQRLTRPDIDFRSLKAAIDTLEFDKRNKALPLYHPDNLHALPVKLLVVKKHSGVIQKLVRDLATLRKSLTEIPALVIDDESDQAGLNTVDPLKAAKGKERTKTNKAIINLLGLLPRAQYVGYTATPYANALIDVNDPEDLFPKDFINSLERPAGYMGVSDFFDPLMDYTELDPKDFRQAELAFIRRVDAPVDQDNHDLQKALRSFVLAGGIKLFRQSSDQQRYNPEPFRHHTMLIHTSARTGAHGSLADRVKELWDRCAFNSPKGLEELKLLLESDFLPVSQAQGTGELIPKTFDTLKPHLAAAIQRVERDARFICVVNSESHDAPDFTQGHVWKIVVGGNKLSRGYTLEGLTVSYYRRVANTGDTLMQMGRWFGFRPGYRDLVRVFLGVSEGKRRNVDLVNLFKEVCRMEERFREELKRYVRRPGAPKITPRQIPPLISISGNLPPTSRNKMFNARIQSKNFGGQWSSLTLTSATPSGLQANREALKNLLKNAKALGGETLGGRLQDGKTARVESLLFEMKNEHMLAFLENYHWLESDYPYPERPADLILQIDFLEKQAHQITSWVIFAPQRQTSFGTPLSVDGIGAFSVKERARIEGRRFGVFGESTHHAVAEYLAQLSNLQKVQLTEANRETTSFRNPHRGIMLLYPVRETVTQEVSIGFELLYPENNLPFDLNFTVVRKDSRDRIVVTKPSDA